MRNKILFGDACSLLSRSALQINAALMNGQNMNFFSWFSKMNGNHPKYTFDEHQNFLLGINQLL